MCRGMPSVADNSEDQGLHDAESEFAEGQEKSVRHEDTCSL